MDDFRADYLRRRGELSEEEYEAVLRKNRRRWRLKAAVIVTAVITGYVGLIAASDGESDDLCPGFAYATWDRC